MLQPSFSPSIHRFTPSIPHLLSYHASTKLHQGTLAVDRYDERPLPRLPAQRLICGLGLGLQDQNFDIPTSRFFIGSSLQDHPRLDEVL